MVATTGLRSFPASRVYPVLAVRHQHRVRTNNQVITRLFNRLEQHKANVHAEMMCSDTLFDQPHYQRLFRKSPA